MDRVKKIDQEAGLFPSDYDKNIPFIRLDGRVMKGEGIKRIDWVVLRSNVSGKSIYRMAQGCGRINGFTPGTVMIGYEDMLELEPDRKDQHPNCVATLKKEGSTEAKPTEIQKAYSVDWTLRRVGRFESIMAYWQHPDSGYQISVRIAIVSLIVGILGFVMGFFGLLL